ncbi:MAG: RNA polymerase sigma factor [Planctomycetes bacterium]|nr:RNA polymerase sigma factor [Planctomycetota bacterium]MCH7571705.1 RNA polymerase sigma factor [Planctomycetota bacterium]MCH7603065.1 RNA polymerase sigma factor [Planctomycetota bacterium]
MEANLHKSAHAHDMPDPQELACRAQAGSLSAFALLVERYQSGVFNFVFRRVGNVEDAEDLTQEAFVRAWERINRYSTKWRFSTWLYTIASRLAINHLRSRNRRKIVEQNTENPERQANAVSARTQLSLDDHPDENIWNIAARILLGDQYTMLWLKYAEDLSSREIARVMGKSQVSVRVTLFRARERLADCLSTSEAQDTPPPATPAPIRTRSVSPLPEGVS